MFDYSYQWYNKEEEEEKKEFSVAELYLWSNIVFQVARKKHLLIACKDMKCI